MKTTSFLTSLALAGFSLSANAATLLSIDFHATNNGNTSEPGFVTQSSDGVTHSTTAGDITVSFTNESGFFSRGDASSPNTALHDDFVFRNGGATFTMILSGVGITALTSYDLTLWAWDGNSAANQTFTGVTGTVGSAAINFTSTPSPADLTSYRTTSTFTSDSSGNITIDITDTDWTSGDAGRLNGLVIAEAIPEPSAALLGGLGMLALLRRRR